MRIARASRQQHPDDAADVGGGVAAGQVYSAGEPSMSTDPIVDYHIIYALALIAVAVTHAGHTWGLGKLWARLPFVQRNRWLI
jgi:hypothetical protein